MEQLKIITKLHSNRKKYFQLDLLSQKNLSTVLQDQH